MQKNDKYYTFLLSQKSKNRIYFRRVRVSKNRLHFSSISVFLLTGLVLLGLGISGVVRNTVLAKTLDRIPAAAHLTAAEPISSESTKPLASEVAVNAGGPELFEGLPEDAEVDTELRSATVGMDPDYLPTVWPHTGKINNEFGFRRNPFGGRIYEFHPGMDIDGERGEAVLAPASGTVVKAGQTGGYGNMVEILHGNGIATRYGHLSKIEVEIGDTVNRYDEIGLIGSTGRSTGPHLHYELRLNDRSINPRHFLPVEPTELPPAKP
jgi:murein DD-endopeptidase MepM/ murein hydrolase activator NlpD